MKKKETKTDAIDATTLRASTPPPAMVLSDTVTVKRETLEATPARLLTFLRALATITPVRRTLMLRGYSWREHQRGWRLLMKVSNFTPDAEPTEATDISAAVAELDAWDEPHFALASAALKHRHPAQHGYVFRDLRAQRGAGAVLSVNTFLDRLDALERSPERESTRAADHAALATLSARGITAVERKRMRGLIEQAQGFDAAADAPPTDGLTADQMDAALREARAFYEEWSTVARLFVTRGDHLIRLGLSHRRAGADTTDDTDGGDPSPEG